MISVWTSARSTRSISPASPRRRPRRPTRRPWWRAWTSARAASWRTPAAAPSRRRPAPPRAPGSSTRTSSRRRSPQTSLHDARRLCDLAARARSAGTTSMWTSAMPRARTVRIALGSVDLDVGDATGTHPSNGGLDLDVGTATVPDAAFAATQSLASDDLALPDLEPVTMSEVGTKLDLARAYMDMGDPDGARNILEEVLHRRLRGAEAGSAAPDGVAARLTAQRAPASCAPGLWSESPSASNTTAPPTPAGRRRPRCAPCSRSPSAPSRASPPSRSRWSAPAAPTPACTPAGQVAHFDTHAHARHARLGAGCQHASCPATSASPGRVRCRCTSMRATRAEARTYRYLILNRTARSALCAHARRLDPPAARSRAHGGGRGAPAAASTTSAPSAPRSVRPSRRSGASSA